MFRELCGPLTASNFFENVVRIIKLGYDGTSPIYNHFNVEMLFQEVYNLILSLVYLWEPLYGEGSIIKR